ncbi:MAG: insulinase family protein, partial [Deltaproteobacteria bacterium]|nr:insulinase family protein [Deltaproteobacteria bacterium]
AMPPVERTVLANGLVLLVSEQHSLPFATLELLVDCGSRRDPPGEEGLAYLTAKSILAGTSERNADAIDEELDFMGAVLRAACGRDYTTLKLQILKKDLGRGLDLFFEILTKPSFPEEEIRHQVDRTLASIRSAEDNPGVVARKAFRRALFGDNPYGHPVRGTERSLPRVTRDGLVRFYKSFYRPNNSILTVVGDVKAGEIRKAVLSRLTGWGKARIPETPFTPPLATEAKVVKIDRKIAQANIILGHGGVSRADPDFYALRVMNYILGGGGFASRLMEEIRNKRGLAYSVASFFDAWKYPGSFQISLQTKNSSAREAISLSLHEMERIRSEPVSEKELQGARKYLTGSFPLRLDTQRKLAAFLTQAEYYGLGLDYASRYPSLIESVTSGEVLRVARTHLHPDRIVLVVVADLKEAGME